MNYFSILTKAGLNKLINATANNTQIILNKMSVSDFNGEINQDLETLPNIKHEFNINSITQSQSDANVLICEGVISADVGGFYIRKVGIYTDDGVLFAVGVVPDSYKPLLSEGSSKDITIKFYLQIDNAKNITLKVDNNIVLATRSHLASEIKKLETKFLALDGKAADSDKLDGKDSSEYALKSELSDTTPIGSYMLWSSEATTPAGFLKCDGRSLNKNEYLELFNVIGYTYGGSDENFNIPNFSDGKFIRSIGGNAAPIGTAQNDAIRNITGKLNSEWGGVKTRFFNKGVGVFENTPSSIARIYGEGVSRGMEYADVDFDASRVVPTANENRPYNMSVVVLIKAKDVKEPNKNKIDESIYATEVKAGIIKIKNSIIGNAEDVAVTEKAVNDLKNQILGVNQNWRDMTNERRAHVVYTNTTGRAIQLFIALLMPSQGGIAGFDIDGIPHNSSTTSLSPIIPAGSTYRLGTGSGVSISKWLELR